MKQTITRKDGIVYERKRKSPMKYNKCLSVRLDEETYNKLKECGKPSTVIKNIIKDYDNIVECNKIMEKYLERIYDLGFDYDGCNEVDSLKKLIDELVRSASLGRACNITEPMLTDGKGHMYNILGDEI